MLVRFTHKDGSPLFVNPRYVIAVCEEKHFGRPGIGQTEEYRDTLILTTKGEFNVGESPDDVASIINAAATSGGGEAEGE